MKINLKNTCYPKPLLSRMTDDYIQNNFEIKIEDQKYEKKEQKLTLSIKTSINNQVISNLINEKKVFAILHLEQKTQRQLSILNLNEITTKEINLYDYATTEPIEVLGILYCADNFELSDKNLFNSIYSLLNDKILYERGDILGYSNELEIKLPEDKRIGSIFNVVNDADKTLKDQPFNVSLNSHLIQILINNEIHPKFISTYKKDPYVKKLIFFSVVKPAIITAFTEMFLSYDMYREYKWCITLSSKIEKEIKIPASDIFTYENYDISKVYKYANIALGSLYKDAIETYESGLE